MFSFSRMTLETLITGLFIIASTSVIAGEYNQQQKEMTNKQFEETAGSQKERTIEKQAETLGTHKVEDRLHERDRNIERKSHSDYPRDQDRAGHNVEEKRSIHSDGPRADGHEHQPLDPEPKGGLPEPKGGPSKK